MQWGKAKTVLIAVLLAVNIFLFLVTQQSVRSRSRLDEEYIDNAISLLSTRGVFIREEDFSSSKLLLSTATISTKEMLYPFARALLEDQTLEPSVEGDGVWFRGEKGSVLLSGAADFSFEAEQPPKDLGEVGELLQMAGFSQEEFVEQDGRLVQTLFDVPMYGCEVSLKNGVVTGRLLVTAKAVQKNDELIDAANALLDRLKAAGIRAKIDDSDQSMGWKAAEYEMKGVPLRVEIGPKDIEKNQCVLVRRDNGEKVFVSLDTLEETAKATLDAIHDGLYQRAKKNLEEHTFPAFSLEEAKQLQAEHGGFIKTMWCGELDCELKMKEEAGMTSRCVPFAQEHLADTCPICGRAAKKMIYWGVAY